MRTYGELKFIAGNWAITRCEPHVSIKLKTIFKKIPKGQIPPYEFDNRPEICTDLVWFMQRYPLQISSEDSDRLFGRKEEYLQKQAEMERLFAPDYQPSLFQLKGTELRPFQGMGVDLYLKNHTLLCGDQVGMGKTFIAMGSYADPRTLPAAVVVQTHLPSQWKEKLEQYTNLRVHIIKSTTPYQLPPADVYLFKYSNVGYWVNVFELKIFKSVVFDEVQELRRDGTDKYRGAGVLAANTDYQLGLSATPIYNYGIEIYNILDLMKDGCLGDRTDFLREWSGGDGKIANPVALGTYLRENYLFLRRTRQEVGQQLPPVNKIIEPVDYDEETVESIESLARTLAIRATSGSFIERGQAARELDILVRHATGVSKAKPVAQYVKMLLECGESVLLAGWHRDVYDIWNKELESFKPVMYTGSESPAQKDRSKKAFISGESPCMMISLRSGVGLDGLQEKASMVVFGELDWSPAIHDQVIGRLDREGQRKQVTAVYCVSNSGSDPLMIDLLGVKASEANDIIDPLAPVAAQHTDESRIKLLAQQFLKKHDTLWANLATEDTHEQKQDHDTHQASGVAENQN